MKKSLILLLALSMFLPVISSLNIIVDKTSSEELLIAGLNKPAIFDLRITNNGPDDVIELYNFVGFSMFPNEKIGLANYGTTNVRLEVYPIGNFTYLGYYTFQYFIKGQDGVQEEHKLTFRRIQLKDAFEVGSGEFDPESNSVNIYIKNKVNFNFDQVKAKFSSPFFNVEKIVSLGPYEKKDLTIELDREDFKQLLAGYYTMNVEVDVEEQKTNVEGTLKFVEKDIVKTSEENYGFIVNTKIIKKVNEGNMMAKSETTIKKNIISRLFTSFNPAPDAVERKGVLIYYIWDREIKPGETFEINVKTNWTLPLIIILLIVAIVVLVKIYTRTTLSLTKRVSFVRAKGGEFALKVFVTARASKYIEKVNIIDRLPPLVKVYEKFGPEHPTQIDEKNRRLIWSFESMEAGEMRTISYIIYSKIGVLGKFALPSATGVFEKDGELHETMSNKAFFVAEQRSVRVED